MATAHKKVVVRQFGAGPSWGYLPFSGFVQGADVLLLLPDGKTKSIPLNTIKLIAYVRDFNLDDAAEPERLSRRVFQGRPRGEGLWLRLTFLDDDQLEGLADFDLASLDQLLEDRGVLLTPPDGRGNTQKVFVPRSAMQRLDVLATITSPTRRAAAAEKARQDLAALQPELFEG